MTMFIENAAGKKRENREPKVERLGLRVTADVKRLIETAAKISGRSVSDLVTSYAVEGARREIKEAELFELSEHDQAVFFEALQNPPEPGETLKKAASEFLEGKDV